MLLRISLSLILLITRYSESSYETIQGRESTLHIDLDIMKSNYQQMFKILPPQHPVMAVVKANAYGIGAVAVSNTVLELGARYLGVAFVDEGVYLRMKGIKAPILVLGNTAANGQGIDLAIQYNLTLNVFSKDVLNAVQHKAMASNARPVKIHIEVNTGVNRIGLEPSELVPFVKLIQNGNYSKIDVEGVFSQFASIDVEPVRTYAENYARKQLNTFKIVVKKARKVIKIPISHIANSEAIKFFGNEASLDMVRPGSFFLGFTPYSQHAMSLTSIVAVIRRPIKGQQLGYQLNTTVNGAEWIATIPLGYADGLRPDCGNGVGKVLIKGKRVPIVSGIMMDMMLVDVSEVYPVEVGDQVVVFGRQLGEEISYDEYAKTCGGTDLSLTTQVSKRIPKIYSKNGQTVYFENNLLMN